MSLARGSFRRRANGVCFPTFSHKGGETPICPTLFFSTGMRRLNVTLEGLIALVTVAQEGSLERGGKTLGLSTSAAGKQISTLEKAVGAKLFEHRRGRWVLNEEGKLLVPEAFQTIFHARMGVDLVQAHVRLRTDHLSVGYSTFLSPILIGIIRQARLKRHNDIKIEWKSLLTEQAVESVVRGELDIGFGYLPIKEPELLVRKVFEEPLAVLPARESRTHREANDIARGSRRTADCFHRPQCSTAAVRGDGGALPVAGNRAAVCRGLLLFDGSTGFGCARHRSLPASCITRTLRRRHSRPAIGGPFAHLQERHVRASGERG